MKRVSIIKSISFLATVLFLNFTNAQLVTTFGFTGTSQNYTVPAGVTLIKIEVSGGQGGSGDGGAGGLGATMIGTFTVTPGDVYTVAVGGAGAQYGSSGGGGGGTGVLYETTPLIIAGGGGGGAYNAPGAGGVITEEGGNSSGPGGLPGYGGSKGYSSGDCGWAAGGGGFYGDGYGGTTDWDGGPLPGVLVGEGGGQAWLSGGAGGINGGCDFVPNAGAFGCGGGGAGEYGGAGGGGYSGGGGGQYVDPDPAKHGGGGGGSFNDGIDQVNTPANHAGYGEVIITELCPEIVISYSITLETLGGDAEIDLTVSGGDGSYIFDWDNDGTGDFDDTEDLTGLAAGTYAVAVDDESGCDLQSESIFVGSQVGIQNEEQIEVAVYPNPVSNELTINVNGQFTYILYNVLGEVVGQSAGNNSSTFSLLNLANGVYTIKLMTEKGSVTKQIIKE